MVRALYPLRLELVRHRIDKLWKIMILPTREGKTL
jgi:hypothetical protein